MSDLPGRTTIASATAERATMLLHWFTFRMLSCATSTGDSFAELLAMLGQTWFGSKKKSFKKLFLSVLLSVLDTLEFSQIKYKAL